MRLSGARPEQAPIEITVAGSARAAVPPERATLAVRVAVEGDDAQSTAQRAGAALERVRADLAEFERPEPPQPSPPSPPPAVAWSSVQPILTSRYRDHADRVVHTAYAHISVQFVDVSALAAAVSRWAGLAEVEIDGVEWSLTDATRERIEVAVLTEAVERAKTRATTMAHAAGALHVQFVGIADPGLLGAPVEPGRAGFSGSLGDLRGLAQRRARRRGRCGRRRRRRPDSAGHRHRGHPARPLHRHVNDPENCVSW